MNNYDSPQNNIKNDELGYSYLAYYFAKIIKDCKPVENSFVIGISGKWGDGKTTLINYIKQILNYSYTQQCDLNLNNYRDVLENIKIYNYNETKEESTQNKINKLAIFNTIIILLTLVIKFFINFNILGANIKFTDIYFILLIVLLIISIPGIRTFLSEIIKHILDLILNLYQLKQKILFKPLEIIDFNPWYYQNKEDIIESFFKLLGQKIKIKDNKKYSSDVNLLLQYLSCLTNIKLPNIQCENTDITKIKEYIKKELLKKQIKYLIIIDDLDRVSAQEALAIFKAVKLLADFPNIIYLLAYDKDMLMNQYPFQNTNHIQKIVQLEKGLPVIPNTKLRDIFIARVTNIINKKDVDIIRDAFLENYENLISKLIMNIRDINRFENSFYLNYITHQNIDEINLVDYVLLALLEEFDNKTYKLIYENKDLLFENISAIDLQKHANFIKSLSNNKGFNIFSYLFSNYLDKIEEIMNSLNSNSNNNTYSSDIPKHNISQYLLLFKYKYLKYNKDDNYRRVSDKKAFEEYFRTNIATSLITDIEYQRINDSLLNKDEFIKNFDDIFIKHPDKFNDFCERFSRNIDFISNRENLQNLLEKFLSIDDGKLLKIFNMRTFCEKFLSLLEIKRVLTKQEMLALLLDNYNDNNLVQMLYWYDEFLMSNIDMYFKVERFSNFNKVALKNKLEESSFEIFDNGDILIEILLKLKKCDIKPQNFKNLISKIQEDKSLVIKLLNKLANKDDYKYYFEIDEIQNILIDYYLETKNDYLENRYFKKEILIPILEENFKNDVNKFYTNLTNLAQKYANMDSAINGLKKIRENSSEDQKKYAEHYYQTQFKIFENNNVFVCINNLSNNPLVIKYILSSCWSNESIRKKLEDYINKSIAFIGYIKTRDNIDSLVELQLKYTQFINEISQNSQ